MRTRIHLYFLLVGLLAMVAACREAPDTVVGPGVPETRPDKIAAGETGYDDPQLHAELENVWNGSAGLLYELFTMVVTPGVEQTLVVKPTGWTAGYEVRMTVPAGALTGTSPVTFSVAVPVDRLSGSNPPSYEFFPDGLDFNANVEVTVCWPEWAGNPPLWFDLKFVESEWHELQRHFVLSDMYSNQAAAVAAAGSAVGLTRLERSTEIHYSLPHFSRWGVTSGTDDGDKAGGDKATTALFVPGVEIGAGCWTMFPPPDNPLPRLAY